MPLVGICAGGIGQPVSLPRPGHGNLYGATFGLNGHPVLFKITTSGQYTTLYSLGGIGCLCLLTQGSDGIIYGTAQAGGPVGAGAVFALDAGLPKPAPQALKFEPRASYFLLRAAGEQQEIQLADNSY